MFSITKDGGDYQVGYNNCPLVWKYNSGNTKNAEFWCDHAAGKLWIRQRGSNKWAIGYNDCPLYMGNDIGEIKNAEFRCGEPVEDVFTIKGV